MKRNHYCCGAITIKNNMRTSKSKLLVAKKKMDELSSIPEHEIMKSMVKNSAFKRNAIPEPEKFFGDDSL